MIFNVFGNFQLNKIYILVKKKRNNIIIKSDFIDEDYYTIHNTIIYIILINMEKNIFGIFS